MERFVHFRCDFQPRVNRPSSIGLPGEAEILNAVGIENKSGDAAGCVAGEGDFADVAHEDIGQGDRRARRLHEFPPGAGKRVFNRDKMIIHVNLGGVGSTSAIM
jgi:hypothetical protein